MVKVRRSLPNSLYGMCLLSFFRVCCLFAIISCLFVGTMMGITNTFATLSGFIGPAVVGALTYRNVSNFASGNITTHCSYFCCTCCWGDCVQNSIGLRLFKSDGDEIWQDFSSSIPTSIDKVGFLSFKMAVMTSFDAEKCCRLVSAHAVSCRGPLLHMPLHAHATYAATSAGRPLAILSIQFLIHGTFVLVKAY